MRKAAFTLVEVLIVIAIILVITGIALPALAAARRRSFLAVDTANLKSLGQAIALYHEDSDTQLPQFETLIESKLISESTLCSPLDQTKLGITNEYRKFTEVKTSRFRNSYLSVQDIAGLTVPKILDSNASGFAVSLGVAELARPDKGIINGYDGTYLRLMRDGSVQKRNVLWKMVADGGKATHYTWLFTDEIDKFPLTN